MKKDQLKNNPGKVVSVISNLPVFWKNFILMSVILLMALCAVSVSNKLMVKRQSEHILTVFQNRFEYDCEQIAKEMYMTYAIPQAINGTRYYDYIRAETSGKLEDKYASVLSLISGALKNQTFLYGDSKECVLYLEGANSIVTRNKCFIRAEACFEEYLRFSDISAEKIVAEMKETSAVKIFPMQEVAVGGEVIQHALAFIVAPPESRISVMTIYSEEQILDKMNAGDFPEGSFLQIEGTDAVILNSSQLLENDEVNAAYHVLTAPLPELRCTASLYIPKNYLSDVVRPAQTIGIILILVAAIIGSVMCFVLSKISVRPIQNLVKEHPMGTAHGDSKNEVAYISDVIKQAKLRQKELQTVLYKQLLSNALSGIVLSEENMLQIESYICNSIKYPFRVAIVRHPADIDQAKIFSLLCEGLTQNMICMPINNAEIGVLISGDDAHITQLERCIQDISLVMKDSAGSIQCGVSSPTDQVDNIHAAVRQAYAAVSPDKEFLVYADQKLTKSVTWLQHERLYQSILINDEAGAVKILEHFLSQRYVGRAARESFYNILLALRSAAEELSLYIPELDEVVYEQRLSAQGNIKKLQASLSVLFCKIREKQEDNGIDTTKPGVISYIQEAYFDSNMCAEMVADRFDISMKKVYSLVRSTTGMSFNEYLLTLRMEKAAELLRESTLGVKEVGERCGYVAESTFYRVFKKYYGVTPIEFRRKTYGN